MPDLGAVIASLSLERYALISIAMQGPARFRHESTTPRNRPTIRPERRIPSLTKDWW
jgi:hypothetical protein